MQREKAIEKITDFLYRNKFTEEESYFITKDLNEEYYEVILEKNLRDEEDIEEQDVDEQEEPDGDNNTD